MKRLIAACVALAAGLVAAPAAQKPAEPAKVREKSFTAPNNLRVTVRVTKPQDLECDLQAIGYFKHKPAGDTVIEAIVDFDEKMGSPIKSLRDRGAFVGDELETIDFTPPKGSIKPKRILLVGYGDESKFTIDVLGRVGTVTAREAVRLGAKTVAFAPALFDQGYKKLKARDVAPVVIKSVALAYDTEKRLQAEGLSKDFSIEQFIMEAGPEHFEEVIAGVTQGVEDAGEAVRKREKAPFHSLKPR